MRHIWLSLLFLYSPCWLQAQGTPELGLDVNGQSEAVVAKGWPLLIRVVVIPAGDQPLQIGLGNGAWTQALKLAVTDQNGTTQNWPVQLAAPASSSLTLSGIAAGQAVWRVAPSDTASIADGLYSLTVTLDTTAGAASGAWSGSVQSDSATVQLHAESATLSSEEEASKYLAIAAYARQQGDAAGVQTALDTLISRQPGILEAYTEKADLLAAGGDYAGALALYQQALDKLLSRNPAPAEPLTLFTAPMADLSMKLASQQLAASGRVTSVAPGSRATVLAPESIANGYGANLAITTAVYSGAPPLTLGGTTVNITDSGSQAFSAPLFFVSPGQVNYEVPPGVALGPATVTVKAGDGTTRTGAVTIAAYQPGLFILNTAGLIAAGILRVTPEGQRVNEDVFSVDPSGSVLAAPVDVANGQVYLTIYGTGIRGAPAGQVSVSVGGANVPVLYSGAQGTFVGLDQINVQLPATLAGRGDVTLVVTAAGKQSNTTHITIR